MSDRRFGRVFDQIAATYDAHRPGYPDALIDHAFHVAGLGAGDAVLEVLSTMSFWSRIGAQAHAAIGRGVTDLEARNGRPLRSSVVAALLIARRH